MNIFYTNKDPEICAYEHCNTHVVKMILEYSQILSTVHHLKDSGVTGLYKPTHQNHPSVRWAAHSSSHYKWLLQVLTHLHSVYEINDKQHKSKQTGVLSKLHNIPCFDKDSWQDPFVAIKEEDHPDIHRWLDQKVIDTKEAYRIYLNRKFEGWMQRTSKRKIFPKWALQKPVWVVV